MSLQHVGVPVEVMVESSNLVGKLLQKLESLGLDKMALERTEGANHQPDSAQYGDMGQALLVVETVHKDDEKGPSSSHLGRRSSG